MSEIPSTEREHRPPSTGVKLALELGPLVLFFAVNAYAGLYPATVVLVVAVVLALLVSRLVFRETPVMPLITTGLVVVFGGLTLYLQDETFIKVKPTIVYAMFAVVLLGGLLLRKPLLELVFGQVFRLTETGWRQLTLRWSLFFIVMAIVNEAVWRNFSTDTWVTFKAFGMLPLTVVFAMLQAGLVSRHALDTNANDEVR